MSFVNLVVCFFILKILGSDAVENSTQTAKNDSVGTECILPPMIENGNWSILLNTQNLKPGQAVSPGSILLVQCKRGYTTNTKDTIILCAQGRWHAAIPKCVKTCSPLVSTPTTHVTCRSSLGDWGNCMEATSQTPAIFECAPFHELSSKNNTLLCLDGTWDAPTPTCETACGRKPVRLHNMLNNVVKRGTYPWNIAVYKKRQDKFDHICGGTLISPRVVVTAAHCVTNLEGVSYDANIFRVAAGKYYRAFDEVRDSDAEFAEIHEIIVAEKYRGSTRNFDGDIALLVTKAAFNISQFILPACVNWNSHTSLVDLQGTHGVVSGWGYPTPDGHPSEVVKEISLPYVPFAKCYQDTPDDFKKYITSNTICAGYTDKGIGVCNGDGGGGLVFRESGGDRYFLRGVLSVGVQKQGNCDMDKYSVYTNIASYIDLIAKTVKTYRL